MGKRQIAAQETRRKIVSAAEELIREKGFEEVCVSDITRAAGVAKGSFYTYFKRKEDVVTEITQNKFRSVEEKAMEADGVGEKIASFLTESMRYIEDTGLKVTQQWLKNVVEPENRNGKEKLRYDTGVIDKALFAAVLNGELRADTPVAALSGSIASSYYGIVAVWAITNGKIDPVERIEQYGEIALRALLAQYAPQRA